MNVKKFLSLVTHRTVLVAILLILQAGLFAATILRFSEYFLLAELMMSPDRLKAHTLHPLVPISIPIIAIIPSVYFIFFAADHDISAGLCELVP